MLESDPDAISYIERMADEADAYILRFIADQEPDDPQRRQDAFDRLNIRETLLGNVIPVRIAWTHPAGWIGLELVGGPGPCLAVLPMPTDRPQFVAFLASLRRSRTTLSLDADFFTWTPERQLADVYEATRLLEQDAAHLAQHLRQHGRPKEDHPDV